MGFYPAFLRLRGKDCLVVGGGAVALQKVRSLSRAGGRVTVVAPDISPALRRTAVSFRRKKFSDGDISLRGKNPWLVVAATDDEELNRRVFALCEKKRIWVNVADRPPLCGFILPSVVRRGLLTFAVSTGGVSPALAKFVGEKTRSFFGPEVGALALILKRLRPLLLKIPMDERKSFLSCYISDHSLDRIRREGSGAFGREMAAAARKIVSKR